MPKTKVGRPEKIQGLTLKKLEEAFAMGCSDKEACLMADISHQTLYDYQNRHPKFVERKEALKETPILAARKTIVDNLKNPNIATWYLERKKKDEFTGKQEIENTGAREMDEVRKDVKDLIDYVKTGTSKTNTPGDSSMQIPA